jgi:hypothetical protein
MPVLRIKLDVDEHGFDALAGVPESKVVHVAEPIEVGTLRAGMQSGKDSVALCIPLPDGRVLVAETSADLYLASARAITGWQKGRRERREG